MFSRIRFILIFACVIFVIGCGESEDPQPPGPIPDRIPIEDKNVNDTNGGEMSNNGGEDPLVDGILQRGGRITVTNTIVDGVDKRLHIRNPEGIESEIIGSAAEGATGIILNGPALGDGWTWWEIAWDNNGKVDFNDGENCCIGWSAETNLDQNVRYLTEIE